jgi:hypothetical protein
MILRPVFSVAVGILSAAASYWYKKLPIIAGTLEQQITVLGTVAQVTASMMGFMLAALAILASITDKPLVKNMVRMQHYRDLLLTLFTASAVYMIAFLLSGSVLIFGDFGFHWRHVLFGSLCGSLAALIQVGWKFWRVLSNLNIEE